MLLSTASDIAVKICYKLQPYCSKINIAGSIRRKKPKVGDIEIVCVPHKAPAGQVSLFGDPEGEQPVKEFCDLVQGLGTVELGRVTGRQMKILLPEGIKLDLFIPQEDDYYRIYAIRTGSAQYSNLVIAHAWKRKGWVGTEHGLRKKNECREIAENKWKLVSLSSITLPPVWESEADFFEWLNVRCLDPIYREVMSESALKQHQSLK